MLQHMARSSSGLGRRPLKAEITGSNPVRATIDCSGLLRESFLLYSQFDVWLHSRFLILLFGWILIQRKKVQIWACALLASAVIYFLAQRQQPSATGCILGCRLMAGQRILVPSMGVRLPPSQPLHLLHMARSSSGLGRRPLKAEITGSNPVRATIDCSGLLRESFFILPPDAVAIL